MGPIERATRDYVKDMGELVGPEAALAAIAIRTAQELDSNEDGRNLPGLSKEMRLILKQLNDDSTGEGADEWGDLASAD